MSNESKTAKPYVGQKVLLKRDHDEHLKSGDEYKISRVAVSGNMIAIDHPNMHVPIWFCLADVELL
jgi:hypothetical protein